MNRNVIILWLLSNDIKL